MKLKRYLTMVLAALLLAGNAATASADGNGRRIREQQRREARNLLDEEIPKDCRQTAKALEKEGWKTAPTALPVARQVFEGQTYSALKDSEGYPLYVMGDARWTTDSYNSAKEAAIFSAKQQILTKISEDVIDAAITAVTTDRTLDGGTKKAIESYLRNSSQSISRSIRPIMVQEIYRENGKNFEVWVVMALSTDKVQDMVTGSVQQDIERDGLTLQQDLMSLLWGE